MSLKLLTTFVLFMSLSAFALADAGIWMVTNPDKNITCLIVQMDIKVNFTYTALDNSSKAVTYQIPANQTTVGKESQCGGVEDTLKVSWNVGNSFDMTFTSNVSKYDLTSFVIKLNTSSLFNDSAINQTVVVSHFHDAESYLVPTNFSYHCNRERTLNATGGLIIVSKVQFEAFKADATKKFSAAQDCDSHFTPDIVPIAVGISLIALIVVVLIAYIVGRRRQQQRGYLNIM